LGASEAADYLIGEIKSFANANPDISVTYYAIQYPRHEEVPLHTLTHLGRNIIGVTSEAGSEPYYLVSRELIVPIDKFLPDPDFSYDLFYENLWDAVTYKGKRWGVPYLCNSYTLMCDMSKFKAVGLSEPPKTWLEFLEFAEKLYVDIDGDGKADQLGANFGFDSRFESSASYLWKTMILQKGGYLIMNGRFDLSHPSLRESYDFIQRMRSSPAMEEDTRRFFVSMPDPAKNYAMHIQPAYRIKHLQGRTDFLFAPLPTFGKEVNLDEKRYYLAIRKSTPEKEAASWKLIKWLSRHDTPVQRSSPNHQYTFPCRKDLLDRDAIRFQFDNCPQNGEFLHFGKAWPVQWHNLETDSPEARNHFDKVIEALFADQISFDEAMKKAETECNAILRAGIGEVEPYALYR
jgi:ABC-type glycerol-3-phosphate transport system substrate-binding protein